MMRILVTGASGGLGQLVINQLIELGCYEIIATSKDFEKAKALDFYSKVEYIPYDISETINTTNLFDFFKKPDILIHLAWNNLNNYKDESHETTILESHKLFLNNLIEHGLKNINVIGTCYEYGIQEGELEESMHSEPIQSYPIAKNKLRLYLERLQENISFNLKWIRVFYVFGESLGRKNLYTLLNQAIKNEEKSFDMSGGEQIRDFLSPSEISDIIIKISIQNKILGIINCCSGKPVILKDFIKEYLSQNNYHIDLNLGVLSYASYEPMKTWGSIKKLNKIITQQ